MLEPKALTTKGKASKGGGLVRVPSPIIPCHHAPGRLCAELNPGDPRDPEATGQQALPPIGSAPVPQGPQGPAHA